MEQIYNLFTLIVTPVFLVMLLFLMYRRRKSLPLTLALMVGCFTVGFIVSALPVYARFPKLFSVLSLPFIAWTLYCFEGGAWQKFFGMYCMANNSVLITHGISPIVQLIFPFGSDMFYVCQMLCMTLLYVVELLLIHKYLRDFFPKLFEVGGKIWILYYFGAMVARLILRLCGLQGLFAATNILLKVEPGDVPNHYLVLLASAWCTASVIFAIVFTRRRVGDSIELRSSRAALEAAKIHYGELTHSLEEAAALRHDIKHHLNTISELAAKKDRSGVEKLVSETQSRITAPTRYCGHGVADALIDWYAKRIHADGIAFETEVAIPGDIPVESADLCVLLGNLLDNAHRAAQSAGEEPYIRIRAKTKPNMLVIETENNFGGKLLQRDGRFLSAKENGGQGHKSVTLICEKYHGTFIATVEGNRFTTLSMLNW
jgi:hypothetical protein